jgi:hypothetical protein
MVSAAAIMFVWAKLGWYSGDYCTSRAAMVMISPRTDLFFTSKRPTVIGSLNRRGPALPGLK